MARPFSVRYSTRDMGSLLSSRSLRRDPSYRSSPLERMEVPCATPLPQGPKGRVRREKASQKRFQDEVRQSLRVAIHLGPVPGVDPVHAPEQGHGGQPPLPPRPPPAPPAL